MVLDTTNERTGGMNVAPALVDEYLDLKEKLEPLEKRLTRVKNLLKDLVTEEGPFVDELRGVTVYLQPRFRKEYDAERLLATFPHLAGCVSPAVDVTQLEACLHSGMATEGQLERAGVLIRTLHSRALIVKPLEGRRTTQAPAEQAH